MFFGGHLMQIHSQPHSSIVYSFPLLTPYILQLPGVTKRINMRNPWYYYYNCVVLAFLFSHSPLSQCFVRPYSIIDKNICHQNLILYLLLFSFLLAFSCNIASSERTTYFLSRTDNISLLWHYLCQIHGTTSPLNVLSSLSSKHVFPLLFLPPFPHTQNKQIVGNLSCVLWEFIENIKLSRKEKAFILVLFGRHALTSKFSGQFFLSLQYPGSSSHGTNPALAVLYSSEKVFCHLPSAWPFYIIFAPSNVSFTF